MNAIDDALAPVLRDVAATSPVALHVVQGESVPVVDQEIAWISADDQSSVGILVTLSASRPCQVVEAAAQVQDWLVECLAEQGFSSNWPECEAHPTSHPLEPYCKDEVPTWRCPSSKSDMKRIGGFGD